jgi:hypothetical protein
MYNCGYNMLINKLPPAYGPCASEYLYLMAVILNQSGNPMDMMDSFSTLDGVVKYVDL